MGDLPRARLDAGALSFTRTAVALFRPLKVSLYRRCTDKPFGVLYTYLPRIGAFSVQRGLSTIIEKIHRNILPTSGYSLG